MAGKKVILTLSVIGGVAVVAAIALLIVLQVVNGRIEDELGSQIDAAIQSGGMDEFVSYGEIQANAARGKITLTDVSFVPPGGGSEMKVASVSLKVPPVEAAALARDPENAALSRARVAAERLVLTDPGSGNTMELASIDVSAEGELSRALLQAKPDEFLRKLSSVEMSIRDSKFTPGEQFMMQMQMMPGGKKLVSGGAMDIRSMDLDADISPESVDIGNLSLDSGLMSFKGSMDLGLGEMMKTQSVDSEFAVERMQEDLRTEFGAVLAQMGQSLPEEGPFTIGFELPEGGVPQITVK